MQYKQIGYRKVPLHRCMNYIYRPILLEHLSAYQYFATVYETRLSTRSKKDNQAMRYLKAHPGHTVFAPCFHNAGKEAIPTFSYNYLPPTRLFQTSLYAPVNKEDIDYLRKEEYCKRFLILFVPFRRLEDLLKDGSYTLHMQAAKRANLINTEMIQIADNIQTIHNSLNSPVMENILISENR